MEITEENIQYIGKKYPNDIRKFISYYKSGIPEKFWIVSENTEQKKKIDICVGYLENESPILILGDRIKDINLLSGLLIKRMLNSGHRCLYHNYSTFMYDVVDKFNNLDKQIYNQHTKSKILCFSGIKPYIHMKNSISVFSSMIDGLLNSSFEKTIILGMEYDGNLDNLSELYDSSLIKTINNYFEILEIKG